MVKRNLEIAVYNGETPRYNFDKYVYIHMEQRQILTDLIKHGNSGIDLNYKVQHLSKGTLVNLVKAKMLADKNLCNVLF